MHMRAILAATACVALIGCASTRSSNQVVADAATQRGYQQGRVYRETVTPRTSTPQAARRPAYPAASYRAPSVQTYAAAPRARTTTSSRTVARRSSPTLTTRSFASVPPPPPPPPLSGSYTRTTINPARAPAASRAVIRPASRPARSPAAYAAPSAAPAVKPLAPVHSSALFRDSGTYSRGASAASLGSRLKSRSSGRACKT